MSCAAPAGGRLMLLIGAALLLAALAAAASTTGVRQWPASAEARGPGQPNVVVVLTDDQRMDEMRAMRRTNRLIGRRGTSFRQSWATFPLCCPSRATLLTGQYAHNHNVKSNGAPHGGLAKFNEDTTIAVGLDNAQYRTAFIGKYLNGYPRWARRDPPHQPNGWDRWRGMAFPGRMWGWVQVVNGDLRRWGAKRQVRHYQTDVLARQARNFVRASANRPRPFFLTVATLAPHGEKRGPQAAVNPRPAPRHRRMFRNARLPRGKSFNERDVSDKPTFVRDNPRLDREDRRWLQRRYRHRLRSLASVDDLVAGIFAELRRAGIGRDTLVIFTSDNGTMLGEHRLTRKNVSYREAAQVPLLIKGPGVPKGKVVRGAPVGNIDIAPTIYDVTGAVPPTKAKPDGISLIDVARNPQTYRDRALLTETIGSIGLRTRQHLYVKYDEGDEELYDRRQDPQELHSLHDQFDLRLPLEARFRKLEGCKGTECHDW